MKNQNEIDLYTEELSAVLRRPDGFWVKSGMVWILLFLSVLVVLSFMIKYPETVKCNLSVSKGAQQYTIESFNNNGEIVYSPFPNKETHLTVTDTVLFIEAEHPENLYARIMLPGNYEKELKLKKELKIVATKKPLESKLIHSKISSIYRSFDSGVIVINVEIPDSDSDFFSEIKSKEISIPAEIGLSEKTLFFRIFSKIKEKL